MDLDVEAVQLNTAIKHSNPVVVDLLSQRGRAIFFPRLGMMSQTTQALTKKINATIGTAYEEDGSPIALREISKRIIAPAKDVFPYAPVNGRERLRQLWLEEMKRKNPTLSAPTTVPAVTAGITHGLGIATYLFGEPGDSILLFDYFWGNYHLIFEHPYGVQLDQINTFGKDNGLDLAALDKKLNSEKKGKKILLLNFPNNPLGYTPTNQEAKHILSIIKKSADNGNKLVVICDDAYFGLVYKKGVYSESLFSTLAGLHENVIAVKVDGATKEEYFWGLRVGFITIAFKGMTKEAADALEFKIKGVIRGGVSNCCHPTQTILEMALQSKTHAREKKQKYSLLKKRFDTVEKVLQTKKYKDYFEPMPHNSGYFMCLRPKNGLDAEAVRQQLLKNYNTGVVSMCGLIRIAYASVPLKTIPVLFENIYLACKDLKIT
ncbi:aminotransferase class I/II-fold pyridoxal phosphate-dependent enzyme [Candidatus Woesearchaeota archaeon]|nr:aminotransferase class I/II-fold pyridoxal phosphate-dependent enzyme [Candidatus Woesearchaeota archaeon]